MPAFLAEQLSESTGGRWTSEPAAAISGFSVDSRRIGPGQAFVALRTARRDGHDYLDSALSSGAVAALVSQAVPGVPIAQLVVADPLAALQAIARSHRRSFPGTVVGITGSAGKTSTKELVALLLGGEAGAVLATEGNLNNHIGVALTLTRIDPSRHRFAVVEAGISAPGEMRVLASMIEPDVAITTLVGPAHLEELGGLEGVAREKAVLSAGARKGGLCIFPSACEAYAPFRELHGLESLVLENDEMPDAGLHEPGRAYFTVSQAPDSTSVSVEVGRFPPVGVTLKRVAAGMASNVALAICAATRLGVRRDEVKRRMDLWSPAPLRGQWTDLHGRRTYLDCYNANPASMADALAVFKAVAPASEPRAFVIGCMEELGEAAVRYHRELGARLLLRPEDRALVIGGHAEAVVEGALGSGAQPGQIEVVTSPEAVAILLSGFRGSVFVKGSRRYQLERAFVSAKQAEASHA